MRTIHIPADDDEGAEVIAAIRAGSQRNIILDGVPMKIRSFEMSDHGKIMIVLVDNVK